MLRYGLLDLYTCLVKIMIEVYVSQKTCIKCLVMIALQKCLLFENVSKYFFYFLKINFDISASKWFENTKKNINLK